MSVVVESKPYGLIKSYLKKSDKVGIVLCGCCPVMCGIEISDVAKLSKKLKKEGFNVVDTTISADMCYFPYVLEHKDLKGNVIVVLGCEAAVYNLKRLFPKRKVVQALTTLGLASFNGKGNVHLVKKRRQYQFNEKYNINREGES